MRVLALAATAVLLSACLPELPNPLAEPPPDTGLCPQTHAHVELPPLVKDSSQLRSIEALACYYGMFKSEGESECLIDPDFPNYPGDVFNFRTRVAEVLIASESYGSTLAHQQIMWNIRSGGGMHDEDACLKSLHDVPKNYADLVELTRSLTRLGY